jgi:hypothetical protein
MQYFVSVENTSYFYWQLELLIESFNMLGIGDSLVVAMAENDSQKVGGFSSNIVRHANKFVHPNEGRERGYLPLNRVGAIRYALAYGALEFPFALIHADMVARRPLEEPGDELPCVVLNNFDDHPPAEEDVVKMEIGGDLERLAEERGVERADVPTVPFFSPPVVFNGAFGSISEVFFARLQNNMISLLERRGASFPCEKAAWELTLTESFQHCSVSGRFMSAPLMFDSDSPSFIHYRTGIPPVFHKKFYRFEDGVYLAGQGPYETIMENNPTVGTDFLQRVVRSYSESRSRWFRTRPESQTCHADADG